MRFHFCHPFLSLSRVNAVPPYRLIDKIFRVQGNAAARTRGRPDVGNLESGQAGNPERRKAGNRQVGKLETGKTGKRANWKAIKRAIFEPEIGKSRHGYILAFCNADIRTF